VQIPDPQVMSTQVLEGIERRVVASAEAATKFLAKNQDDRS
jgi:hypothetical protein